MNMGGGSRHCRRLPHSAILMTSSPVFGHLQLTSVRPGRIRTYPSGSGRLCCRAGHLGNIVMFRAECGIFQECRSNAPRASHADGRLTSRPPAARYPSSISNPHNKGPRGMRACPGDFCYAGFLILKALTSFRPCRRRLRALRERVL